MKTKQQESGWNPNTMRIHPDLFPLFDYKLSSHKSYPSISPLESVLIQQYNPSDHNLNISSFLGFLDIFY